LQRLPVVQVEPTPQRFAWHLFTRPGFFLSTVLACGRVRKSQQPLFLDVVGAVPRWFDPSIAHRKVQVRGPIRSSPRRP
jgi:hypothetical protein